MPCIVGGLLVMVASETISPPPRRHRSGPLRPATQPQMLPGMERRSASQTSKVFGLQGGSGEQADLGRGASPVSGKSQHMGGP